MHQGLNQLQLRRERWRWAPRTRPDAVGALKSLQLPLLLLLFAAVHVLSVPASTPGSGSRTSTSTARPKGLFSTRPLEIEDYDARCSGPGLAWLREYARWHRAHRHADDAKYLVHLCGEHAACEGLGKPSPNALLPPAHLTAVATDHACTQLCHCVPVQACAWRYCMHAPWDTSSLPFAGDRVKSLLFLLRLAYIYKRVLLIRHTEPIPLEEVRREGLHPIPFHPHPMMSNGSLQPWG